MELLRERAGLTGVKKGKRRNDDDDLERAIQERDERERGQARDPERAAEAGPSTLTSASGHINLFEDLERVSHSSVDMDVLVSGALMHGCDVRRRTRSRWCPCARQRRERANRPQRVRTASRSHRPRRT